MSYDASIHQIDEKGRQSRFHDMPAKHHDYSASISFCRRDRGYNAEKIAGDQNVGQRLEKRGEAPVAAGRRCKFFRVYLVGTTLDGDSANLREIGFRDGS
jgi:hypothetical protein